MSNSETALLVRVRGRVQGVNYRDWTRRQAQGLGLKGWVRNEPDGSVRALIVGNVDSVAEMTTAMWKGPPAASVSDVETQQADIDVPPDRFDITG